MELPLFSDGDPKKRHRFDLRLDYCKKDAHLIRAQDVDSVALLESFRALKLTLLESFRALKLLKP